MLLHTSKTAIAHAVRSIFIIARGFRLELP